MRNLIMGGIGFIGSNFTHKLIKSGEEVVVFDRYVPNIDLYHGDVCYVKGNFHPDYDFLSLTENVDIVYHFISTTIPASNMDIVTEISENVITTIKLLDACVKNNVKKIVFLSSGGTVYGHSLHVPRKETDATDPINSYGIQKLTIEKYLHLYKDIYDLDCKIIRLSNPYGPFQNPKRGVGAVTAFTYAAVNEHPITIWGDGKVIRDYIYIDDVVDGIYKISCSKSKETLFNLGSGKGHDLLDVLKIVQDVTQKKLNMCYSPARQVDLPYNVLDNSKYTSLISSEPGVSLERGISDLAEYYQSIRDIPYKKIIAFRTDE